MAVTLSELLAEADAAVASGANDRALKTILNILHKIADGQLIITDTELGDDIAALENKADILREAGDETGALKAERQAKMLRSADTIVDQVEADRKV
jgi:propanediol dehydratase small subunit